MGKFKLWWGKFKQWILAHKLASIITASALVVCVTLSIVLPITLSHKHKYDEKWAYNATSHWHECMGEKCDKTKDNAEHTFVNKNDDTQYWSECSVCGYQKEKINAKVTDTQLANAIQFIDADGNYYTNLQAECEGYNSVSENVAKKLKLTEDNFYFYDSTNGTENPQYLMYAKGSGNSKSEYKRMNDNASWIKETGTFMNTLAAYVKPRIFMVSIDGSAFDYNSEDNTYRAETPFGSSLIKYTIKFANGKMVSVVLERIKDTQQVTQRYSWTISYGNATVELPEVTAVTKTQWENLLAFSDVNNFTQSLTMTDRTIITKVTENSASLVRRMPQPVGTSVEIYDLANKKHYTQSNLRVKYTVTDESSLTFDTMLSSVGSPANIYSSIKNSFDDFTYNADEKVYYKASARIDSEDRQDVKLTFNDARLTKVEYKTTKTSGAQYTTTITYTYGDTIVIIPSDSDVATLVPYESSSSKFLLNNITLSAGEFRWFVIDITSAMITGGSSSATDIITTFDVGTGSTLPTISFTVKDKNGDSIEDESETNGSGQFAGLTAGKCYIMITASEDCTGSLSVVFG